MQPLWFRPVLKSFVVKFRLLPVLSAPIVRNSRGPDPRPALPIEEREPRRNGTATSPQPSSSTSIVSSPSIERPWPPWAYLALGLATAPVFAWTPVLGFMGWFLGSLCHEMGHSAVAWFFGMPAFPAIRLDGHAASIHQDQVLFLALLVWAVLGALAWSRREHLLQAITLGVVTLLYPAFAFTGGKEILHLLGGHLGELAMASYCFVHVLDGGFTQGPVERTLYGTLGWHLLGRNVLLCTGLVFRSDARAAYAENGSFGLANDYIRVAEDVLGWSLPAVAIAMLLVCLVPLPLALWVWIGRVESAHAEEPASNLGGIGRPRQTGAPGVAIQMPRKNIVAASDGSGTVHHQPHPRPRVDHGAPDRAAAGPQRALREPRRE